MTSSRRERERGQLIEARRKQKHAAKKREKEEIQKEKVPILRKDKFLMQFLNCSPNSQEKTTVKFIYYFF